MPMMADPGAQPVLRETWRFVSLGHMRGDSIVRVWRWSMETPTRTAVSSTLFKSLELCMRDAKLHGFSATIDAQADALKHSAYTFKLFEDGTVTFTPEV
jgi:methyl coenzyme M reductase gamma subunit